MSSRVLRSAGVVGSDGGIGVVSSGRRSEFTLICTFLCFVNKGLGSPVLMAVGGRVEFGLRVRSALVWLFGIAVAEKRKETLRLGRCGASVVGRIKKGPLGPSEDCRGHTFNLEAWAGD